LNQPPLPKLIRHEGPLPGEEIELTQEEFTIGRDPQADLVIPSPSVSRRHARIFRQDGQYLVEDLGSSNKTYVNDDLIAAPRALQSGDMLRLGSAIHFTFFLPTIENPAGDQTISETLAEIPLSTRGQTLLEADLPPARAGQPPELVVTIAGDESQAYRLKKESLSLGRSADNDIVIRSPIVSGHHARLEKEQQGYMLHILPEATNPVYFQGAPLQGDRALHDGDILRFGSQDPGVMVTLLYQWPAETAQKGLSREILFGDKETLQIGRDPSCDVALEAPNVSRFHAVLSRVGQRFRLRDLNSTNGTFVNEQRIDAEIWLKPGDSIRIGPYHFKLGEDRLAKFDDTHGLRVEVLGLNKWVRPDLNLLKDISLIFQPREFVVVVGQSGGGKSTLVDAVAGYRPATHGQVLVNDVDIYAHFDAIRSEIGFVPQKDIIHTELTVYQALDYAARLRMPADTTKEERHERVMQVLQDLDLVHRKEVQISGLSGGQQKRVSIGVELLTRPGLFFLDEPSSGLDPGTETALMHLMRHLADQGRTIILITHATKNVMLADKVVFLARGGYLAWFGPPDEALAFFDQYRPDRDRRARAMEFDEIYAVLDDPGKGKAEDWANRYQESAYYQTYIAQPLQALGREVSPAGDASQPAPDRAADPEKTAFQAAGAARGRTSSALRQFVILSSRNIKILSRDRISLFLMLASAPLVAMVDVVLALILGRNLFAYTEGSMGNALITLYQPAIFAVMVGALAMMREFVKETEIFRRERLVNLKVLPYVMSKIWVAALLALYQAAAYTVIHNLSFKMPGGVLEFSLMYITLVLATLAGMTLGLLASAIAPNANAAPLIVILLIVPQVVLGGAVIPVPGIVSAPTSTRWGFEALVSISGAGADVAADACWALPEETRDGMSLEDKAARGCRCMGLNALNQAACNFPGVGSFYDPVLDQPRPAEPAPIGSPPAEPALPAAPEAPADQTDQKAMAQFLQDLQAHQAQVEQIEAGYKAQLADYQAKADTFAADATAFQKALGEWEIKRNTAVNKAESLIDLFHRDFGWAFVDKDDSRAFGVKIVTAWGVQVLMIAIMLALILVSVYRKDRV
jgi:ABC-type multidrug transport system ATPase subunit/predicted component of type VI protein secretion system